MRQIKFRVWNENKMFYGTDDLYSLVNALKLMEMPNKMQWMQFTGLKDANGKEIYEGDIIAWDGDTIVVESPRWYVCDAFDEYGYHNLGSFRDDYGRDDEPSRVVRQGEVIGNIYENPKLLT